MKTNNKQIVFIFLGLFLLTTILTTAAQAQEANIQGIGFITPEIIYADEVYDTTVQNREIKLYNQDKKFSGTLIRWQRRTDHAPQFFETMVVAPNGDERRLSPITSDLVWTSYKSFCFQYFAASEGYVKVRIEGRFYWLNMAELIPLGFGLTSWFDYYRKTKSKNITANYNLNLRESPNADGEKILLLIINRHNDDFFHFMTMTGNFQGNWAEVEVSLYESMEHYCPNGKPYKKVKGWIKFLDDSGFPNVQDVPVPCG